MTEIDFSEYDDDQFDQLVERVEQEKEARQKVRVAVSTVEQVTRDFVAADGDPDLLRQAIDTGAQPRPVSTPAPGVADTPQGEPDEDPVDAP